MQGAGAKRLQHAVSMQRQQSSLQRQQSNRSMGDNDLERNAQSEKSGGALQDYLGIETKEQREKRAEFLKFNELQNSRASFIVYCALTTTVFATLAISSLYTLFSYYSNSVMVVISGISLAFCLVLVAIICALLCIKTVKNMREGSLLQKLAQNAHMLQSYFVLTVTLYFSFLLNAKLYIGDCTAETNAFLGYFCVHIGNKDGLPAGILLALIIFPMSFFFLLRDTRYEAVLLSWTITTISIALTMIKLPWNAVVASLMLSTVGTFIIFLESHRHNLAMYLLARQFEDTLLENERLAEETHAQELRHMIANVAHDLKTPLTSFLTGVDFIAHSLEDCEEDIRNSNEGLSFIDTYIQPMQTCIDSIRNTNAFMTMTINRCIDYTKASIGMKLVPKQETIDLLETLALPLRVMRNLQNRLEICVDDTELMTTICSHIITDKQWLQENLLCLLSNAVKYSTKGKVLVRVKLVRKEYVTSKPLFTKGKSFAAAVSMFESLGHKAAAGNSSTATPKKFKVVNDAQSPSINIRLKDMIPRSTALSHGNLLVNSSRSKSKMSMDGKSDPPSSTRKAANDGPDALGTKPHNDVDHSCGSIDTRQSVVNKVRVKPAPAGNSGAGIAIEPQTLSVQNLEDDAPRITQLLPPLKMNAVAPAPISPRQHEGDKYAVGDEVSSYDEAVVAEAAGHVTNERKTEDSTAAADAYASPSSTKAQQNVTVLRRGESLALLKKQASKIVLDARDGGMNSMEVNSMAGVDHSLTPRKGGAVVRQQMVLKIEVEDTGIGLSEEAMRNLFNPFKQAQRLAGGTGLGLYSLAKRLEALGGYYGVQKRSDGQQGSMFWFAFNYRPDHVSAQMKEHYSGKRRRLSMAEGVPQKQTAAASGSAISSVKPSRLFPTGSDSDGDALHSLSVSPTGGSSLAQGNFTFSSKQSGDDEPNSRVQEMMRTSPIGSNGVPTAGSKTPPLLRSVSRMAESHSCAHQRMDILLVDDSISILKMTGMMLKRQGHNVEQAENGMEAIEKLFERLRSPKGPYDVVLMDLQMPVMDGLEAVRRLRLEESEMRMRASSKSARSTSVIQEELGAGGSDDFGNGEGHDDDLETQDLSKTNLVIRYNENDVLTHSIKTRKQPRFVHQLVIGCSANSDHDTMQEALKAGVDAFMAKPFSTESFYEVLGHMKSLNRSISSEPNH